jgi:hypothetical protein
VDRLLPAVALHHVHRAAADPAGLSGFPSNTAEVARAAGIGKGSGGERRRRRGGSST